MTAITDLMVSKVRVKILELFFEKPVEIYYVREITRAIKEEINAVRRELDRLLACGLLKSEQRGNRLYYYLNTKYLFYQELQLMVAKTTGLGKKIRQLKSKLGNLDFVMFSGKFARGQRPAQGEIDALFIGDIVLPELQAIIKEHEALIKREVNYAVFTKDEFEFRKTRRDPFVMDVLFGTRVMLIGSEEEFCQRQIPGL